MSSTEFKEKRSTDILTVLSICLVLVLIGIYGVITIHSSQISNLLKESVDIMVELDESATEVQRNGIFEELTSNETILRESVKVINPDEAKDLMIQELGDAYMINGMENPFRISILFRLKAKYFSQEFLEDLTNQLAARPEIVHVFYQEDFYRLLMSNLRQFSFLSLGIGLLLLFLAAALIYNTVFLSLNADRLRITTMELVGASWSFIKRPYLKRSLKIGSYAGIAAILIIGLLLFFMANHYSFIGLLIDLNSLIIIFLLMLFIGIVIPLLATFIIVTRYLRKIYV